MKYRNIESSYQQIVVNEVSIIVISKKRNELSHGYSKLEGIKLTWYCIDNFSFPAYNLVEVGWKLSSHR